ncbi:MAG: NAD(+) synthase [Candidatus Saccharimonadales bacterium]
MKSFDPTTSYMRIATGTPEVKIGDVPFNTAQLLTLYKEAVDNDVSLITFPELSITSYSLGDTVRQHALLRQATDALLELAAATTNMPTAMVVGLPFRYDNRLYNCAAFLADGEIKGLVTKSNLPNYGEFYEQRWYQPFIGTTTTIINDTPVPFGQHLLFEIDGIKVGVEICEDLWVSNQPSRALTETGALIIVNPSASPELVGKAQYRTELVRMTSAVERCVYVYAGADWTESTTDIVMGGHALIAENGSTIAERAPFTKNNRLMVVDIDFAHLLHDRIQDTTRQQPATACTVVGTNIKRQQTTIDRTYPKSYFLPAHETPDQATARLSDIFAIQAHGLARRIQASKSAHVVLGLSGGLDSTLALLVALKAAEILDKEPVDFIHALTMPGPASSKKTQNHAVELANILGVTSKQIPISGLVAAQLEALEHAGEQDITYENVQARTRTNILFNYANKVGGLVLGTGDLSELVLGWCTFGGDHLSSYNVNASIPKTLVRNIVSYVATTPQFVHAKVVLKAIVATPISPELTSKKPGEISQSTEDLIGPYIVHDFILYHVLRFGDEPNKINAIAETVFADEFQPEALEQWMSIFFTRFAASQFKRSVMPDGPKVGSVAVSPRGDWRMPSDMPNALWNN